MPLQKRKKQTQKPIPESRKVPPISGVCRLAEAIARVSLSSQTLSKKALMQMGKALVGLEFLQRCRRHAAFWHWAARLWASRRTGCQRPSFRGRCLGSMLCARSITNSRTRCCAKEYVTMLLGLAANRLHHQTEDAALFALLRACESGMRELNLGLHAVGRTYDAIAAANMMHHYSNLVRYPYGREGGLMKLVAEVVGHGAKGAHAGWGDLSAPTRSIHPPSSRKHWALKRQCVIHGKPFISTVATARDWVEMERMHAGLARDRNADRFHDFENQTVALIAHDAMKPAMLDFVAQNFDLLSRFKRRVGTGTTGQKLNELAWSKRLACGQSLGGPLPQRPLGGDAQIADLVLERRCQRAIFFEDPHVSAPARSRHSTAGACGDHRHARGRVHHHGQGGAALV